MLQLVIRANLSRLELEPAQLQHQMDGDLGRMCVAVLGQLFRASWWREPSEERITHLSSRLQRFDNTFELTHLVRDTMAALSLVKQNDFLQIIHFCELFNIFKTVSKQVPKGVVCAV